MMDAAQPGLEIGEYEVNDGQEGFGDLRIAQLRDGGMNISAPFECRIAAPVVGNDGRAWRNGAADETAQRFGTPVWHRREPDTPGVPSSLPLVEAAAVLALPNFDRAGDDNHVVNATALATGTSANVGFIGLNVLSKLATNPILIGSHHADTQLVKNLERSLVARESELPLELNSRHAGRLAGDQVGRPEPDRERRVRALHNGAGGEACIAATLSATEYAGASGDTVRLAECAATMTDKPVAPSGAFKIGGARRFIRKQVLKLRQRARKRQIASPKYIDSHGRPKLAQMLNILPIVGVCDNPISTIHSMPAPEDRSRR